MAYGYKVVKVYGGDHPFLGSITSYPGFPVNIYTPGEKTTKVEGNGPLAVWESLDDAKAMLPGVGARYQPEIYRVYKCRYKKSKYDSLWIINHSKTMAWTVQPEYVPAGTAFADYVILNKKPVVTSTT